MSTSQHTAEVVVKGNTEGASKALKQVEDGAGKAKKAVDAAGDAGGKFGEKLDAIEGKLGKFNGTIGKVTSILGGAGLVGAAMGAAEALGAMADRAAQIEGVNQALKISIEGARNATMGMVSDFQLASTANKALQLGVVRNEQEFAKLTATAAKLGMAMGQDVAQSVSDLTTGLGRQSFEILDNLGIILKAEEAYDIYAQRIGKVASELTDAEKKQAFMTIGLERAEEAAAKSNVTLDTYSSRVIRIKASWENFTDTISTTTVNAMGAALEGLDSITGSITDLGEAARSAQAEHEALVAQINATPATGIVADILVAGVSYAETLQAQAKAHIEAAQAAEEQFAAEQKLYAETLIGPALPAGGLKKKGGGRAKKKDAIAQTDRGISDEAGLDISEAMGAAELDEYNEGIQRELELREDRITLIEHEMSLAQMQVDAGLMEADMVEDQAARKYEAEVALLDFQIAAAQTREEILDLETQKRRKAVAEQMRVMTQAQAQEIKALQVKQQRYKVVGEQVAGALGQVALASIKAAEGEEYAVRKALAALATGIRDQMILTSLKEFALAIASAASYNYPAAAQHAAAGGLAAAAAAVAGGLGAAANASIPSEPDISTPSSPDSGGMVGTSRGGGGKGPGGGGDDDGVPTSYYDADLWQKRPDRQGRKGGEESKGSVTVNAVVLGSTKDEVGLALDKVLRDSRRESQGRVRA